MAAGAIILRMKRILILLVLVFSGCDSDSYSPSDPQPTLFTIDACDQQFRVRITDAATAREAQELVGDGNVKVISGVVRAGNGGFNTGWNWHLDPATIDFADMTIELCDGCPNMVEEDPGTWVGNRFCPWSTKVIAANY